MRTNDKEGWFWAAVSAEICGGIALWVATGDWKFLVYGMLLAIVTGFVGIAVCG